MSTHNIGLYEEIVKIIFQLSSKIHLICSSDLQHVSYRHRSVDLPTLGHTDMCNAQSRHRRFRGHRDYWHTRQYLKVYYSMLTNLCNLDALEPHF